MGALKLQDELPHYTYDDYIHWEGRWEVISGVAYAMSPMPKWRHQRISGLLFMEFQQKLKNCKRCKVVMPIDWEVRKDTIVQPDNLIVCDEKDDFIKLTKTPALVAEILSPSTAIKDKNTKYRIYEEAGVQYYLIIDPDLLNAEVYLLRNGKFELLGIFNNNESCEISLNIDNDTACPFTIDFCEIFDI